MIEFQEHRTEGQAARIELTGRLDSAGVETIEAKLTASIRNGTEPVLIDLTAVSFVGSLGIRLLISCHRVLQRQDRRMAMFGAQPQVAEVFETVALSDLIPVAANEHEARATLSGQ